MSIVQTQNLTKISGSTAVTALDHVNLNIHEGEFVAIPDERLDHLPKWMLKMYEAKRKFALTPEKMAETHTWLAADPAAQNVTDGYWDAPGVAAKANKKPTTKKLGRSYGKLPKP